MGHPCPKISMGGARLQVRFQVLNGGHEVHILDYHHQVDGIEVSLAGETSPKIGSRIGGGPELAAEWTEKHATPLAMFVRPVQADEQVGLPDRATFV